MKTSASMNQTFNRAISRKSFLVLAIFLFWNVLTVDAQGNPYCPVCGWGKVITEWDAEVFIPTFGSFTCERLHERSQEGFVPASNCLALQMFSRRDCGCEPTEAPTKAPVTLSPTNNPTLSQAPTVMPSLVPSVAPTTTVSPTQIPSSQPSPEPTPEASSAPTSTPSSAPSAMPSPAPSSTRVPTSAPSPFPTNGPTLEPSATPSIAPSESLYPSAGPTASPSNSPTPEPSSKPSMAPTISKSPSETPSATPSTNPTTVPSPIPSETPTMSQAPTTSKPSIVPTATPTLSPSVGPSLSPSVAPTTSPTVEQSSVPTLSPTVEQSSAPSPSQTVEQSSAPSPLPTVEQSSAPSLLPTVEQSSYPSNAPTSLYEKWQSESKDGELSIGLFFGLDQSKSDIESIFNSALLLDQQTMDSVLAFLLESFEVSFMETAYPNLVRDLSIDITMMEFKIIPVPSEPDFENTAGADRRRQLRGLQQEDPSSNGFYVDVSFDSSIVYRFAETVNDIEISQVQTNGLHEKISHAFSTSTGRNSFTSMLQNSLNNILRQVTGVTAMEMKPKAAPVV